MNNRPAKTFVLLVLVVITGIALMNLINSPTVLGGDAPKVLRSDELNDAIKNHNVISAEWQGDTVTGEIKPDVKFTARVLNVSSVGAGEFEKFLRDNQVPYKIMDAPIGVTVLGVLSVIAFPVLLILVIYFLVLRPAQMGVNKGRKLTSELERLAQLFDNGKLTQEEFDRAKAKLLGPNDEK